MDGTNGIDGALNSFKQVIGEALSSITTQAAGLAQFGNDDRFALWSYLNLLGSRPELAASFAADLSKAEQTNPNASAEDLTKSILDRYVKERRLSANEAQQIVASATELFDSPAAAAPGGAASPGASAAGGTGGAGDASPAFLWKPRSDSDGKLAVLLPSGLTGKVAKVEVIDPHGKVLAKGRFSGVGNGSREHYRFSFAGDSFPDGSKVRITFKDGTTREITVAHTAQRFEKRG